MIPISQGPKVNLPANCVGAWDIAGSSLPQLVTDLSGNGINAQMGSTPTVDANDPVPGAQGITGNGTSRLYMLMSNALLNFGTGNFTLFSLIKMTAAAQTFWSYNGTVRFRFLTFSNQINVGFFDGSWLAGASAVDARLSDGNWHSVATTVSGGNCQMYIDGISIAPRPTGGTTHNLAGSTWTTDDSNTSAKLVGPYAFLAAFSRVLTDGEIALLHQQARSYFAGNGIAPIPPSYYDNGQRAAITSIVGHIQATVLHGGNLYAVLDNAFKVSSDGGQTWSTLGTFASSAPLAEAMLLDSSGNFYVSLSNAITAENGVLRSTNGGATWTKVVDLSAGAATYCRSLAQDNLGYIYCGTYYAAVSVGDCRIFRSTDGGATFSLSMYQSTWRHVHSIACDSTTGYVYATTGDLIAPWNNKAIVVSRDHGATWNTILSALPQMVGVLFGPGYRLFGTDSSATTGSGIYRTTDDSTAALVLPFAPLSDDCYWIRRNPVNGFLYAGTSSGSYYPTIANLYRSTDDGNSWDMYYHWDTAGALTGSGLGYYSSEIEGGWLYSSYIPQTSLGDGLRIPV